MFQRKSGQLHNKNLNEEMPPERTITLAIMDMDVRRDHSVRKSFVVSVAAFMAEKPIRKGLRKLIGNAIPAAKKVQLHAKPKTCRKR